MKEDWNRALARFNIAFTEILGLANEYEARGDARVTEAFRRTLINMARDCLVRERVLSSPKEAWRARDTKPRALWDDDEPPG